VRTLPVDQAGGGHDQEGRAAEPRRGSSSTKPKLRPGQAHHENAKTKRDHGDAVRKAKTAVAYADEAMILQNP
jgi:hypothetical protein